ncbi:MAG: methyltransferase domain-containing protein [Anaerolineae bacterium]|nr:methyltransferase domain-containing protein [Anaerolineae bacterium]
MSWVIVSKKGLVIRNHGQKAATPYLRKWMATLSGDHPKKSLCLDIGCGNLRNTALALEHGFRVLPIDHHDDAVVQKDVGNEPLPVKDGRGDLILLQFMLMFLTPKERTHLYSEVNRVAAPGAHVVIELEDVKSAVAPSSIKAVLKGMGQGWEVVNQGKKNCILKKVPMRVSQMIRLARRASSSCR